MDKTKMHDQPNDEEGSQPTAAVAPPVGAAGVPSADVVITPANPAPPPGA